MSYIISIDPGITGAIVVFDRTLCEIVDKADLPTQPMTHGGKAGSREINVLALREFLKPYAGPGSSAGIEAIVAKPIGQTKDGRPRHAGPVQLMTMGRNYGLIKAALLMLDIGLREIAPMDWKGRLNLSDDKKASIAMACSLYPAHAEWLGVRHDRAEAALIVRGILNHNGSIA